jgi:uncharacterized protein YegL
MKLFGRNPKQADDQATAQGTPVADGMISLVKQAAVSLEKHGADKERAAVYLVLDHSGSMDGFYGSGAVQNLAEEALGMSANLDDDGQVPVVFFESSAHNPQVVDLGTYQGWVQRAHQSVPYGSTNYGSAMDAVVKHYRKSGATDPALVIFQTDGQPDSEAAVERKLREYSAEPILWFFVGFGDRAGYLNTLPGLSGRTFDNVGVFQCGAHPQSVSAASLYETLTMEFARMLRQARAASVLR